MHRSQFRRIAVAFAAAVLAAAAAFAMASPEAGDGETSETIRRVEVHQAGEGDVVLHKIHGGGPHFKLLGRGALLGVGFVPLTPELRRHFGAPENAGVLVSKVVEGSAAQAAGIAVGDILLEVDGKSIGEGFELGHLIREHKAGDAVSIALLRDGRQQTVSATLAEVEGEGSEMFERKVIALHCKDSSGADKDCPDATWLESLACGEAGRCEVKVKCEDDGACTCTVNGEQKACPEGIGTK